MFERVVCISLRSLSHDLNKLDGLFPPHSRNKKKRRDGWLAMQMIQPAEGIRVLQTPG